MRPSAHRVGAHVGWSNRCRPETRRGLVEIIPAVHCLIEPGRRGTEAGRRHFNPLKQISHSIPEGIGANGSFGHVGQRPRLRLRACQIKHAPDEFPEAVETAKNDHSQPPATIANAVDGLWPGQSEVKQEAGGRQAQCADEDVLDSQPADPGIALLIEFPDRGPGFVGRKTFAMSVSRTESLDSPQMICARASASTGSVSTGSGGGPRLTLNFIGTPVRTRPAPAAVCLLSKIDTRRDEIGCRALKNTLDYALEGEKDA